MADAESCSATSAQPIGPGLVVLVVGPSGAGKDAVLQELRRRLANGPRVVFPTRIITREPSATEDHGAVTPQTFENLLKRGAFALHWQAHGLHYGIPAEIDSAVREGSSVVFNASRHVVRTARARYARSAVVLIDAPFGIRALRLAARERERAEDIAARLARVVPDFRTADADLAITNTGTLAAATDRLLEWLRARLSSGTGGAPDAVRCKKGTIESG